MAVEAKRGCGYRKIGGLYLVGGGLFTACDRLPLPLESCPVCGGGIHFTRAMTEINPARLFGNHEGCTDSFRPCHVCDPADDAAYIMSVGQKHYTPQSFMEEAMRLGVSKRIPYIPKNMKLGHTVVYLAHPKAVAEKCEPVLQQAMAVAAGHGNDQTRLLDAEHHEYRLGIFFAFIPRAIEKIVTESYMSSDEGKKEQEKMAKKGVTLVPVPDSDEDHR